MINPISPVLLVFPVTIDASEPWVTIASALGFRVVGASSEKIPSASDFQVDTLEYLPFVTDECFAEELDNLINAEGITVIFTAHYGVWLAIQSILDAKPALGKRVSLCGPDPMTKEIIEHERSSSWAKATITEKLFFNISSALKPREAPGVHFLAGLYKRFRRTPGQCDDSKLRSLCALMQVAPKGDVVEIGSLYGRSAVALSSLASWYGIGSTVSVDPWSFAVAIDQGKGAELLREGKSRIDFDHIFEIYLSEASQAPGLGYIRNESSKAIDDYRRAAMSGRLISPGLGEVFLSGEISILHVDGNHSYDNVRQDVDLWLPLIKSSGWLLLDDYVWAFGDGPRRVGDELLSSDQFDCAFVVSDTLFLRKR